MGKPGQRWIFLICKEIPQMIKIEGLNVQPDKTNLKS